MDIFSFFVETLILSVGAGSATVAVVLYVLGPAPKTPDARGIVGRVYSILKIAQTLLFAVALFYFSFFLLDIAVQTNAIYGVKLVIISGTILAGYLMTKHQLSPKVGVIFTASGWYTYSLVHIIYLSKLPVPLLTGAYIYGVIAALVYILLQFRDKLGSKNRSPNDSDTENGSGTPAEPLSAMSEELPDTLPPEDAYQELQSAETPTRTV